MALTMVVVWLGGANQPKFMITMSYIMIMTRVSGCLPEVQEKPSPIQQDNDCKYQSKYRTALEKK